MSQTKGTLRELKSMNQICKEILHENELSKNF